jgi:hypothetical protein
VARHYGFVRTLTVFISGLSFVPCTLLLANNENNSDKKNGNNSKGGDGRSGKDGGDNKIAFDNIKFNSDED